MLPLQGKQKDMPIMAHNTGLGVGLSPEFSCFPTLPQSSHYIVLWTPELFPRDLIHRDMSTSGWSPGLCLRPGYSCGLLEPPSGISVMVAVVHVSSAAGAREYSGVSGALRSQWGV